MEEERTKQKANKAEQSKLDRLAKKGGNKMPLFQHERDSVGYSHHDFEELY